MVAYRIFASLSLRILRHSEVYQSSSRRTEKKTTCLWFLQRDCNISTWLVDVYTLKLSLWKDLHRNETLKDKLISTKSEKKEKINHIMKWKRQSEWDKWKNIVYFETNLKEIKFSTVHNVGSKLFGQWFNSTFVSIWQ